MTRTPSPSSPTPSGLSTTRASLHAVAEHVLAPARFEAERRIGLVVTPGGFATPVLPGGSVLAVERDELVVRRPDAEQRAALKTTTLGTLADVAEVDLSVWHGLYPAVTPADRATPVVVDPEAASVIAEWYGVVDGALHALITALDARETTTLWPEHFDVATALDEVDYGGSPGDVFVDEPYAYVGPRSRPLPAAGEGFWNAPFGAVLRRSQTTEPEAVLAFFLRGRELSQ